MQREVNSKFFTMKKKHGIILACLLLLAGIVFFCPKDRLAESWIGLAKRITRQSDRVSFGFAPIDSLYGKNQYRYFLFVKENGNGEKSLISAPAEQRDSLLILSDDKQSEWIDADKTYVPSSGFSRKRKADEENALYRITGVTKRTDAGNLYQLERM